MQVFQRNLLLIVPVLAMAVAPVTLIAQTRVLRGFVTDGGEPVRGAVVRLEDLGTLQVRSYITQQNGEYHFAGLSTEVDYRVWATRDQKQSSKKILSKFNTAPQAVINLELE